MRSSLSPAVFHRRRRSQSVAAPGLDDILFPKLYEDEWELADARNTDLERARFFMIRFANTSKDPTIQQELVAIASNQQNRTIPALASSPACSTPARRSSDCRKSPVSRSRPDSRPTPMLLRPLSRPRHLPARLPVAVADAAPRSTPARSTPTSPLSATISSWGTTTASTSTTSITRPRLSWELRWCAPVDRATSLSTAICSSCQPRP